MWQKWVAAHRAYEDKWIAIVQSPDTAACHGRTAEKLKSLTPIEREQMLSFMLRYRGWRGYAVIAKAMVVFSLLGGLAHLAMPLRFGWVEAMVLANCIMLSLGVGVMTTWFNYRKFATMGIKLPLMITGLATAGALFGGVIGSMSKGHSPWVAMHDIGKVVGIAGVSVGVVYTLIIGAVSWLRNREFDALSAKLLADAERERLARQLSDAQLRLLQAQIEPHFLFNTLGAVQQLAEQGAPRAAELTANLIQFLRASLSEMRTEHVTLTADFALIEAYLKVMKARLGERLQFQLDLPAELASLSVPGMMLLTLVENAIKHGIEPALRGGEIRVAARAMDGKLYLRVQDGGVGLATGQSSQGLGINNVRDRLQLAFGDAAGLTLIDDPELGGALAEISLPLPANASIPTIDAARVDTHK